MVRVFIDGSAGTTGLKIFERFQQREDIKLLHIPEAERKNLDARVSYIEEADISFLCLPDEASRQICPMLSKGARVLDTSTAHRTDPSWVYGLPEISGKQRDAIAAANRVAVPGCHATGFLSIAVPLISLGVVSLDYPFSCHSITGYSGGGKQMIARYEAADRPAAYASPRQYGLSQQHKHLPEMQKIAGLTMPPLFMPIVADFFSGMLVTVPLHTRLMTRRWTPETLAEKLREYYQNQRFVTVNPAQQAPEEGMLDALSLAGTNELQIYVYGTQEQIVLAAQFDNLGKGASGAAVQCMNIMLGLPEDTGL